MPRLQILNSIEKQALEHIAATSSDEVSKRAKILLGLNEGKKYVALAQEIGVTENSIAKWKKRWTSSTILSETQESAIAKANEVLGVNVGRPPKSKSFFLSSVTSTSTSCLASSAILVSTSGGAVSIIEDSGSENSSSSETAPTIVKYP